MLEWVLENETGALVGFLHRTPVSHGHVKKRKICSAPN